MKNFQTFTKHKIIFSKSTNLLSALCWITHALATYWFWSCQFYKAGILLQGLAESENFVSSYNWTKASGNMWFYHWNIIRFNNNWELLPLPPVYVIYQNQTKPRTTYKGAIIFYREGGPSMIAGCQFSLIPPWHVQKNSGLPLCLRKRNSAPAPMKEHPLTWIMKLSK